MALPPHLSGLRLVSPTGTQQPHTLELYLDYTCPFSAKMFRTLNSVRVMEKLRSPATAARLAVIFRPQIQPWHPASTLVHEAALAVQRLAPGEFWAYSAVLFGSQQKFFDESVVGMSREEVYRELVRLAEEKIGVDAGAMEALLRVERVREGGQAENKGNQITGDVKMVVRMGRAASVHVSPTVVVNGVVNGDVSSGWDEEKWIGFLDKLVAE